MRSILLAALALTSGATPAWAHAHLEAATPADGATLTTPPAEIRLDFSEGVVPGLSGVALSDAAGGKVTTGKAGRGPKGDAEIIVPVTGELRPGTYTVRWHVVSMDSHKTQGSLSFTVKP